MISEKEVRPEKETNQKDEEKVIVEALKTPVEEIKEEVSETPIEEETEDDNNEDSENKMVKQAVILAAGKSTRCYPLTINIPKPMLKIVDKPIIMHNLDQLNKSGIKEAIIIVGYKKEKIMEELGFESNGIKIQYVIQKEQNGSGSALMLCKDYLDERFMVINGDDLYSAKDIKNCLEHEYCVAAKKVDNPENYAVFTLKEGFVTELVEKPNNPESNLVNIGVYVLQKEIFDYTLEKTERKEYEIVDFVSYLIEKGKKISCEKVEDYWISVTYPWNYLEANVFMLKNMTTEIGQEIKSQKNNEEKIKDNTMIKGKIEDNVTIKGNVIIEEGAIIKSNSYIEGPVYIGKGSKIGPMCHIRPNTIIMDNCEIGKTELYDAVIMNNSVSKHTAYIAHSVVGEKVNIGAGTITADYRHDAKNNMTIVKGKKIDSGRRKLGAFIGDNVRTGIGSLFYPGRKLWPGTTTLPGEVVKKDKEE